MENFKNQKILILTSKTTIFYNININTKCSYDYARSSENIKFCIRYTKNRLISKKLNLHFSSESREKI